MDEREDLRYTEKRIVICFSPTAIEKAPESLRPFLYLLKGAADTSDPLVRRINTAVAEVKRDGEFRRTVMDQFEKEAAIRSEGYEEGKAEMKAEAEANQAKLKAEENLKKGIRYLLNFGHNDEEILSALMSDHTLCREEAEKLLHSVKETMSSNTEN